MSGLANIENIFINMDQPRFLFVYFYSFQQQFYRQIVDFSGIWTWIIRIEGKQVDQAHQLRLFQFVLLKL